MQENKALCRKNKAPWNKIKAPWNGIKRYESWKRLESWKRFENAQVPIFLWKLCIMKNNYALCMLLKKNPYFRWYCKHTWTTVLYVWPDMLNAVILCPDLEAEVRFSPRLVLDGSFLGGGVCPVEGGSGSLPSLPWWGGGGEGRRG